MANKILKTLTLPNAQGEPVTYELHPEWDNIEGKPENFGQKGNGIFYIEGTEGQYVEYWEGTHEKITEYYPGLVVAYKTPNNGAMGTDVVELRINNLSRALIVGYNGGYIQDEYPAGTVLLLVYTIDNGTGYWKLYDTDTKNTAGAQLKPDTKLYLVGSKQTDSSSSTNWGRETYANNGVYIGTDNCLYSNGKKVATNGIYYVEGTETTRDLWEGTHEDITSYYPGLTVLYKLNLNGRGGDTTSLNINNLGRVAVSDINPYLAGSIVLLVYTVDANGTAYWKLQECQDTQNTAGTEDATGTKLYLAGGRYQSSYGTTTYSNNKVYIGTDNCLYSNDKKVITDAGFKTIITDNGSVYASSEPTLELYGEDGVKTRIRSSAADSIIYIGLEDLITIDEIDEICGASIVTASEVTF